MKKAALINDISGLGNCSLIAGISVVSAFGVQPIPMPTAVLSAQTEYVDYYCRHMTDAMPQFTANWKRHGENFDGILTGFFADPKQAEYALEFIDEFHRDGTLLLVDPVMGDGAEFYDNYSEELLAQIRLMTAKADIVTPNITELCLLAGEDAARIVNLDCDSRMSEVRGIARRYFEESGCTLVVTGVESKGEDGKKLTGNLVVGEGLCVYSAYPLVPLRFTGAGDLLAATVMGGRLKGMEWKELLDLAGEFIYKAAEAALKSGRSTNEGSSFQEFLYMLTDEVRQG